MDGACAVLVLHHVEDLAAALAQMYRVLRKDGVLVAVIPHPWTDHPSAAWVPGSAEPRRMIGAYGREGYWSSPPKVTGEDVASVHDIGWYHRTLGTWMTSLSAAGFRLTEVREPTGEQSGRPDGGGPWSQLPRFLSFSAVKAPATS
jgi:SAM-dependent methyltransferase